jgi:hypothetical protein
MQIGYWWEATRKGSSRKIKRMWVDNIKMDFSEIELSDVEWIDLAQNRDQGMLL